ncbi:hypothetical protein BCR41DRAFT_361561 [Lobosporangium transversale]|uniref:Uncharacterized protein n=1 Tax=Lobosporangium transversale TaxID=64571 RepID=A0A1Y2GAM6_9FUNG|nr:hypothetical protein BCR41DRAFT_361561 [Lobosporangium transversale]ORZ05691.1 hypothetical protein BCR41DRAFT_361561 [Lobosporangium transversale]|eukprot:XP_021877178.1 hypothetical protein BCR41DRAFT_361561 [Lobosporangium transversale]
MRLQHFCMGSAKTQDLLVSRTFAADTHVQKVWSTFLDLWRNEHRLATLHTASSTTSDLTPENTPTRGIRGNVGKIKGQKTSSGFELQVATSFVKGEQQKQGNYYLNQPLYSRYCCYIYYTTEDLLLVACCPLPHTPSTSSMTITSIPALLPGQGQSTTKVNASINDLTTSTQLIPRTDDTQTHQNRPELAFSTAARLQLSLHGTIEFLSQLVKTLERLLLTDSNNHSNLSRATMQPYIKVEPAISSTGHRKLTAEVVQLNTGIVYEILDECLDQGYPMMPSLTQLDLLVFGMARNY